MASWSDAESSGQLLSIVETLWEEMEEWEEWEEELRLGLEAMVYGRMGVIDCRYVDGWEEVGMG